MIFIGCAGIAMGITIFLIVVDLRRNNGVLNAPGGTDRFFPFLI